MLSLRDHATHRYLRDRYGFLLDAASKCWLKDLEFRFVAVSEGFAGYMGLPPGAVTEHCDEEFFAPAECDQAHRDDLRVIHGGHPIVAQKNDSSGRWYETTKIPLRGRSGRIIGTAGFCRDITQWKRFELQLSLVLRRSELQPAEAVAQAEHLAAPPVATRCAAWLWRVRGELDAAFTSRISVPRLAAQAGVHPDYLSRVFHEHFGMPISVYLKRRRVERAAQLLAGSNEPIAAVAAACGFADQSHLTRVFHELLGISPGRFRRAAAPVSDRSDS